MKKYTAHLVGYSTTAMYVHTYEDIQVDSEEEAKEWCNKNSYMGGYDWFINYLEENKEGKETNDGNRIS